MQAARKLQPEVTVSESSHELILHVHGKKGHRLQCMGIDIHTRWPVGKTSRLLRNLVRGLAFSRWLINGGEVKMPSRLRLATILLSGQPHYETACKFDISHGNVPRSEEIENLATYHRKDGVVVCNSLAESHALGGLFSYLADVANSYLHQEPHHPTLIVGHANWVLMSMFGTSLPAITFTDTNKGEGTVASPEDDEMKRLFGAGLMGARSWIQHKVRNGEDPAWSRSFLDKVGKIHGVDMLKTTFVVEFLQQHGPLRKVLDASKHGVGKNPLDLEQARIPA